MHLQGTEWLDFILPPNCPLLKGFTVNTYLKFSQVDTISIWSHSMVAVVWQNCPNHTPIRLVIWWKVKATVLMVWLSI